MSNSRSAPGSEREAGPVLALQVGFEWNHSAPTTPGKTTLAAALARLAAEEGHRVYFTTATDLAARARKARLEGERPTAGG